MRTKPLLLVVEDDSVIRLMLTRFLQRNGYQTVDADNGKNAVESFDRLAPDMVLMDAKMPGMDGFDACAQMKQRASARHVPILMITGLNDDESVDRAFEVGATDFITKPIHWAILRNRVQYLLNATKAEQELYLAAIVYENTTEAIVVTDPDAVIQSVNPAFTHITGYTANEAVGQKMNMMKSGHHDREFFRKLWATLAETDKWQGEIWNRRKNGEVYPEWATISAVKAPNGKTSNYVGVFTDLTAIKETEQNLIYLSGHDALTDLPNRLLFQERLSLAINEARRSSSTSSGLVGIILLDLDRFKMINDTVGHDFGDRILVEASKRLERCVPSVGTLARLGGDEFGVIYPRPPHPQDVAHVAQAILDELQHPFIVDEMSLFIGASLGISVFPLDGEDVKSLVKNADAAMYHAKESGRNNFQFYRDELNASAMTRMLMENSLRSALDREEFLLYYQPKVELKSGALIGMEALIRWKPAGQGMVSPAEFIPLAEETGLIIPIGKWALQTACMQTKLWNEMGFHPLRVAVNLSGIQFDRPDFVEMVAQVLVETGLDSKYLELELTESIAMGDVKDTLHKLRQLEQMDISLAIDDFGTGFSSLNYLKRFPIHSLKIDQSFVRNCTTDSDDAAIIRTVIGLAHSLNLRVVAEGVETPEQLEFLRKRQCDEIQGYLYSRPLPVKEFTELLEESRIPLLMAR